MWHWNGHICYTICWQIHRQAILSHIFLTPRNKFLIRQLEISGTFGKTFGRDTHNISHRIWSLFWVWFCCGYAISFCGWCGQPFHRQMYIIVFTLTKSSSERLYRLGYVIFFFNVRLGISHKLLLINWCKFSGNVAVRLWLAAWQNTIKKDYSVCINIIEIINWLMLSVSLQYILIRNNISIYIERSSTSWQQVIFIYRCS